MIDKKLVLVDYYNSNQNKGGVQTVMDNFKRISSNVDIIDSSTVIKNQQQSNNLLWFELGVSAKIDKYLRVYNTFCKPDFIIKNSCVATFHPMSNQIALLQDNNIRGPEILNKYGLYNDEKCELFRYGYTNLQRTTMENSITTVAVSKQIAEDYEKELEMEKGTIKVIPLGVDNDFWTSCSPDRRNELRTQLGIPINAKVGISVTKYHQIKGFQLLTKLCRDFPDVYWIIVTSHTIPNHLKVRLKNVLLLGNQTHEAIKTLYQISDFYVCTSMCESFGLAPIEAMSCGVPLITTSVGQFAYDKGFKNYGIAVGEPEYNNISSAVDKIMTNKQLVFTPEEYIIDNNLTIQDWVRNWISLLTPKFNNY